jgi:hypothetical protein
VQIGLLSTALGAALLWIDSQYLAGIGPAGLPQATWVAAVGFGLLFLGLVAGIGDGVRRLLRRAVA